MSLNLVYPRFLERPQENCLRIAMASNGRNIKKKEETVFALGIDFLS